MALMLVGPSKETKHKKGNLVGRFLHAHILGLIAPLTDVINDSIPVDSPVIEQRRCVRALEEMIRLCKDYARIARPQVCRITVSR
jgi:serine/threonine-protein kinase ATR